MSIPNASKYVIIGAGIHGLSTAYHLALELKKRNLGGGEDILVIDKSEIGCSLYFVHGDHRGIYWN